LNSSPSHKLLSLKRSQEIKDIFHAAAECEPAERPALLDRLCAGDDVLRRQVESLLALETRAASFLEIPAIEVEARAVAESRQPLEAGRQIARFRIVSQIGEGGGGEVYLAQDTKLGRKVALKLLTADSSDDPERLSRFEMEARLASSLNHPNITTVYDIGEDDGLCFIASEFVEGETLRHRIERDAIDWRQAVEIASQIASALDAAHSAGIVHRDIKPENVILRIDGCVKLLDFGIAKLANPLAHGGNLVGLNKITAEGTLRGTAEYMSPEQARGAAVDPRSDIFSMGVLVYEMIVGRRPFTGKTVADVIAAILKTEPPPLRKVAPQSPAKLEGIVTRALRKEPESRHQSIGEMLAELKSLKESSIGAADDVMTRATDPEGPGPKVKVEEEYEEFNPLLSELDFSSRLRNWMKRNPLGGKLALLTSLSALAAILLSRYVGAAGIRVTFKSTCGVEVPDLYFGYLIELNAGLFYLIGAPLIVTTSFHLLNFAHVALRRLASGNRLVVNQRDERMDAEERDDRPLAIIARHNRKLCGIAIPIIVVFVVTLVAVPEYRGLHRVAFGWVQALYVGGHEGATVRPLQDQDNRDQRISLPRIEKLLKSNLGCAVRILKVERGRGGRDRGDLAIPFAIFLAVALGIQMVFLVFVLLIAVKLVFLFVLLIRSLLNGPNQRIRLELDFEDENRQFGLSGLDMIYNSFLTMIALQSSTFLLARLANIPKGSSFFSGAAGWELVGQAVLVVITSLALALLIAGPVVVGARLLQTVVEEHLKKIDAELKALKSEIARQRDLRTKQELQEELRSLQMARELAQQQRPWPRKNSLYRRLLLVSFLLLFILPIGIEAFGLLEGGWPLIHLMDSLAKFLYDLC
jgi:serine/threonine protein kinase